MEFYGHLFKIYDTDNVQYWAVVDQTQQNIHKNKEFIQDGDFLEVYDTSGRIILSKTITEDYDTFYDTMHKCQLMGGIEIAWAPKGVDIGYWDSLFNNRYRAKLTRDA